MNRPNLIAFLVTVAVAGFAIWLIVLGIRQETPPGEESPVTGLIGFGTVLLIIDAPCLFFTGLLLYADLMMLKVNYHLRKGRELMQDAEADLKASLAQGKEIPEELLQRRAETAERAWEALRLYEEVDAARREESATELDEARDEIAPDVSEERISAEEFRELFERAQSTQARPGAGLRTPPTLRKTREWNPGSRVEMERPAVSDSIIQATGAVFGGIAATITFFVTREWELTGTELVLGLAGIAALVALAVAIFLQGFCPRRRYEFDWKKGLLQRRIGSTSESWDLKACIELVLRTDAGHVQLDAAFPGSSVMLFDSADHLLKGQNPSLDEVERDAKELAEGLKVPLRYGYSRIEPGGDVWTIWKQSSPIWRWGLGVVVAIHLLAATGLMRSKLLGAVGVMLGAVSSIAVPVIAGITIGQRWVNTGRKSQANALGMACMVAGGLLFGFCAGRSKDGSWESVPTGDFIGATGSYLGLGILLFGLGMFMRRGRKIATTSA